MVAGVEETSPSRGGGGGWSSGYYLVECQIRESSAAREDGLGGSGVRSPLSLLGWGRQELSSSGCCEGVVVARSVKCGGAGMWGASVVGLGTG